MDFNLSEEQQAVAELANQIIGDHSDPTRLRDLERSEAPRFDRDLWAALAEAGLLGIAAPETVGGNGLTLVEAGLVIEAAARHAAAAPVWETVGLAVPVLAANLDRPGVEDLLRDVISGTSIATAGWQEEVGEPLEPKFVTASGSGDARTLTGTKVVVPAAVIADAVIVPAATPEGPGLFLVRTADAEVVPVDTTAGTPDGNVTLSDTPATLLALGEDALRRAYDVAVATKCAAALGTAESAMRITAEYTKERKQFDVPIASFQAVGHRMADTYIDVEAIRLTTWQALWLLADGRDATIEVSAAQYWAAHSGHRVSLASAHLHGGVGGDRDYPLHRHFLAEKQHELNLGGATAALRRLGAEIAANA